MKKYLMIFFLISSLSCKAFKSDEIVAMNNQDFVEFCKTKINARERNQMVQIGVFTVVAIGAVVARAIPSFSEYLPAIISPVLLIGYLFSDLGNSWDTMAKEIEKRLNGGASAVSSSSGTAIEV